MHRNQPQVTGSDAKPEHPKRKTKDRIKRGHRSKAYNDFRASNCPDLVVRCARACDGVNGSRGSVECDSDLANTCPNKMTCGFPKKRVSALRAQTIAYPQLL